MTDAHLIAADEVIRRCRLLSEYTEEPGWITRTFLSSPMHDVHALVRQWMHDAGLSVGIDAAGNIRGVSEAHGPRLLIASHLDTVPHAGAFDGILGVMCGIELAQQSPDAAIEVMGFSEEEGVRYGVPFIGSRAITGTLDVDLIERISPAIQAFGLDPSQLPSAMIANSIAAYLEIHIEQGPVLDELDLPLGIVAAIAGQSRFIVRFQGRANHAGTTPMPLRYDALAGAAEWISLVERDALGKNGLVATVGSISIEPNASNVIPGLAVATLDVRHADDGFRRDAAASLLNAAKQIALHRGLELHIETRLEQEATPMDPLLVSELDSAAKAVGLKAYRMISGAGHDAMIAARRWPSAMLFVRSPGGISHHPDETVLRDDVASALAVGMKFVKRWCHA